MKATRDGFGLIELMVGVFVISLSIIAIFFFWQNRSGLTTAPTQDQTSVTASPSSGATNNPTITGWKTYQNSKYNYSLQYPPDWEVDEAPVISCPPESSGCRENLEVGDWITIHSPGYHTNSENSSAFWIEVKNSDQDPISGSYAQYVYDPIVIDGVDLFIETNTHGSMGKIVSSYTSNNFGTQTLYTSPKYWTHKGNNLHIIPDLYQGVKAEDVSTVIDILKTLSFK